MKRTIENCTIIKNALKNEIGERPETEQHEGKTYCVGYEGAFFDPYHICQDCKVSIYSLEAEE